jgi:hypothetical protein
MRLRPPFSSCDNAKMRSPLELLDFAQNLAARIPRSLEYSEERNAAWLAVGRARLQFDGVTDAQKALQNIDEPYAEAQLRLAIGKWAGEHEDSEIGRGVHQETLSRFSSFECYLAPGEITGLIPSVFKLFGIEAVHSMAQQLEDPFTAGNVYVTLAFQLPDAAARREQLRVAEELANRMHGGNRDWALRRVFNGYKSAGLAEDAERVRHLTSRDPAELTRDEGKALLSANQALAKSDEVIPRKPPDTPIARLRRYLDYRYNDLKVIFLLDASSAGGITDSEMEELVRSDSFQRIEAARPPRVTADTSSLGAAEMAHFLFARPICRHRADEELFLGQRLLDDDPDANVFVRQMTEFFREFGRLAEPFSPEQIEQGLWFVLGHPFWLSNQLADSQVSPGLRGECLRSMLHPFRDYCLQMGDSFAGSIFGMWWDLLLAHNDDAIQLEIEPIALEVLRQILQLPSKACQFAALHGLNHMHPYADAAAAVRQYLEEHRTALSGDELAWVEACARGAAL